MLKMAKCNGQTDRLIEGALIDGGGLFSRLHQMLKTIKCNKHTNHLIEVALVDRLVQMFKTTNQNSVRMSVTMGPKE